MPCRREEDEDAGEEAEAEEEEERGPGFLLPERPVARGGSGEVDRLVAQIGETLQLDAGQDRPASPCAPPAPPRPPAADKARPPERPLPLPLPSPAPGALRCALGDRGRVRGLAAPYFVAELAAGPSALSPLTPQPSLDGPSRAGQRGAPKPLSGPCRRGWLRGAAAASGRLQQQQQQQRRGPTQPDVRSGDDDPHRLLQQLVLSGNLVKEAVRRLHSRGPPLPAKLPPRPLPRPPPPPPPPPAGNPGDGVLVPGS